MTQQSAMKTLTDAELDDMHVSVRDLIRLLEDERSRHEAEVCELRRIIDEQQRVLREQHSMLREACGEHERDRAPAIH